MTPTALVYALVSVLSFYQPASDAGDDPSAERGKYLVRTAMACTACHGEKLDGGPGFEEFGARIRPRNITPDDETGIGAWSDAEIIEAIRNGIRPDGKFVGWPMPVASYKHVSDQDMAAMVAYLRTVEPVSRAVESSVYPEGQEVTSYGERVETVSHPDSGNKTAWGKYSVHLAHCLECHTPWDRPDMTGAGGNEFKMDDMVLVTANLTPAGPVADYSDAELATVIRTGVRPDGSKVFPFMAFDSYKDFTDEDVMAIVAWLRTLPPAE